MSRLAEYREFLRRKAVMAPDKGFAVLEAEVNPLLRPHQRDLVRWSVAGGRRGVFAKFGLGKGFIQQETCRLTLAKCGGGRALITAPLNARVEFLRDAKKLGGEIKFIRSIDEADKSGLYITNFETVRDGKIDPGEFEVCSLDEASVLRGFGGTKTFREFMRLYDRVPYRFVATATPDPNEIIELLAYAAFLGIMDVAGAKTRFFKRDSEEADHLTLHAHKTREFWLWVSTWAVFLQKPSDLGYEDGDYRMPDLEVRWHEIPSDHSKASADTRGQHAMFRGTVKGVVEASREKRDSISARVAKMQEIMDAEPEEHFLLWHDLEAERHAIEKAIPTIATVYGNQDLEEREQILMDFADGKIKDLATKPVIAGSGSNFQMFCSREIFLGIGFKFNDFIQAIHRTCRFLQPRKKVIVDIIHTEAEREVKLDLLRKWEQYDETVARMTEIIRQYGLNHADMMGELARSVGVERSELRGENFVAVNNDCVEETMGMDTESVDMVLTSIPFSTQYEYTPSYNDFGHTDNNEHFFEQMDFLTPELLRTLKPGRIAAIHVKDRIVPGGMTGLGFQSVYPFHAACIAHFQKHGFAYMGMKTIVTDVVRENNQTYRLGYTEMCKDASKIGVGMPEYLLLFRKPQTDRTKGYADSRVVKERYGHAYSLARWQVEAHAFARSSGDRLLDPAELRELDHQAIFKLFKDWTLRDVYDHEKHVRIGEELTKQGRLPSDFMLLQPASLSPDVWDDIFRAGTINQMQVKDGKEKHLCPLQFDIIDRALQQYTNEGETVYDPFGGLMSVPYRAIKLRRRGIGCELNGRYFADGCSYLQLAERKMATPTLFDLVAAEEEKEVA